MSFDAERLFELLPAFYRIRDIAVAEQLALLDRADALEQWAGPLTGQEEAERSRLLALRQMLLAAGEPFLARDAARLQELEAKRQTGPLKALLGVLAEQVAVLEENLAQSYDDRFIETCAEWVVPYIGDLVGTRGLFYFPGARKLSQRAQVANTLAYRRRKGTASVVEQLARDVTEWNAGVVEYFARLATAQYLNHLRPDNLSFSSVRHRHFAGLGVRWSEDDLRDADHRQWQAIEYASASLDAGPAGTLHRIVPPFDTLARTADVRSIERRRGTHNIPNIGMFLWRLGSYPVTDAPAYRVPDIGDPLVDGRRFLFNAAGLETRLYNAPVTEDEIAHLARPENVPAPLGRRALDRFLESYYGPDKSLFLADVIGLEPPSPPLRDLICICDLSDRTDEQGNVIEAWARHPADRIAIDPMLGRLAFPKNTSPPSLPRAVRVSYRYGFSAELGGGEYGRGGTFTDLQRAVPVSKQLSLHTIQEGVDQLLQLLAADPQLEGGVAQVADNDYYVEPLDVHVPGGRIIEIRAADERRPTLVPEADVVVGGDADGELVLNGLLLASGTVILGATPGNRLRTLRLRHCTLVPGATPDFPELGVPARGVAPKLVVLIPGVELEIDSSIIGGLLVHEESRARITNSIIDSTSQSSMAYAGPLGPGGSLTLENTTVVGRVHTTRLEASNTIFLTRVAPGNMWSPPQSLEPVVAERTQEGCVRFSYIPPGSRVPRRFRCVPLEPDDDARVCPVFNSLRYGDAAYAQLSGHCAVEIRQGADDGAEMGAFHDLYQPQRVANLRTRLDEYLRFGLEAGIFFAS